MYFRSLLAYVSQGLKVCYYDHLMSVVRRQQSLQKGISPYTTGWILNKHGRNDLFNSCLNGSGPLQT